MNPILKSRDYHRSYQKWEKLLIDGKADSIKIIPGSNTGVFFTLSIGKVSKHNNTAILDALKKFPTGLPTLNSIREDFDGKNRI